MDQKRLCFLVNLLYFASIAAIAALTLRFVLPWFWPFLLGLGLAYLFRHISQAMRVRGKAAVACIGVAFYLTIIFLFWALFVLLAGRLVGWAQSFPEYMTGSLLPAADRAFSRCLALLQQLAPQTALSVSGLIPLVSSSLQEMAASLSASLLGAVTNLVKQMPLFVIGFVFMIVSSFAIAADYERVTKFLLRQLPRPIRPLIFDIKDFLITCVAKLAKAYGIIMLITFAELSIGLWALRVERFWKFAAIIPLLDMLPLVGSGAILVPWGIYSLFSGQPALGAGLLILYAVIAVLRNIIEPRVVGDQLGLHPAVTLTAMFLGLKLWGLLGMLLAPVAALLIRYLNTTGQLRLYRR
ncbi:MAG: sporulation integral membrane protein YtvI [Oscillospiraceae bacterium]|nr:MAG: sporulation integral membrane protein YtvI [Oscillospiraceae bacterium]